MKDTAVRTMKLSILIPVYGQADLARAAILSASRYLGVVDEIRVVDDKPDDPLIAHHRDVVESSERIRYSINPVNLGRTGTYNRLLRECSSELFLMLDGDDYLAPEVEFAPFAHEFEGDPDLVLVCGRCCEIHGDQALKTSGPLPRGRQAGLEYFQAWVGTQGLFPHSACIVRRSAAIACGGYPDEILNSDIALLRSVLLAGGARADETLMSYWRFHGSNASKIADVDMILANFDSVLIPYRRGRLQGLDLARWLARSTRTYLVSAFHQIMGAAGGHELPDYARLQASLVALLARESPRALWGVVSSWPKVLTLAAIRLAIGRARFARMMARRGNYVYISGDAS